MSNIYTEGPPCDKHFQIPGHNFNAHAKFAIIEEVYNKSFQSWKFAVCSNTEKIFGFWNCKLLFPHKVKTYHLFILKVLLDPFGSHFKTRF